MTEEERRNRNPAAEICSIRREDYEKLPLVPWQELDPRRAYFLESPRHLSSWNFAGIVITGIDAGTLDVLFAVHFCAPRIKADVFLAPQPDGTVQDGDGNTIWIREYQGPDA